MIGKESDRCKCGHVYWAHWPNGQCAHCNCTGKPITGGKK